MSDDNIELIIDISPKHIFQIVDGVEYRFNVRKPSYKMIQDGIDGSDCKQVISEWMYNSIEEEQRATISAKKIYEQEDCFFNKFFLEYLKDDENVLKIYNNRVDSEDSCKKFIFSQYENSQIVMSENLIKISQSINAFMGTHNLRDSAIVESLNKFLEDYLKCINDIKKVISSLNETFSKFQFPFISEERKIKLTKSYEKWGEYGWTQHPEMPLFYYEYYPETQKEADEYAMQICNSENVDLLFKYIKRFEVLQNEVSQNDVEEAIFCYNHKCYKACILMLFTLIERELMRLQKNDEKENLLVCEKAVKYFNEKVVGKYEMQKSFISTLNYKNLYISLLNYFQNGKNFTLKTNVMNKNFVSHAMETKTASKEECIKLFLVYYNLLDFLDVMNNDKL